MNIIELLTAHGIDGIDFQNLDQCLLNAQMLKNGKVHITFGTEARRTELRHGTLHLVKATMAGFKALPPPPGHKPRRPWTEVLQLNPGATKQQIEESYRLAAKKAHPDMGGSTEAMAELTRAKEEALKA